MNARLVGLCMVGMLALLVLVATPSVSATGDYCYKQGDRTYCCSVPTCDRMCTDIVYPWWQCYVNAAGLSTT